MLWLHVILSTKFFHLLLYIIFFKVAFVSEELDSSLPASFLLIFPPYPHPTRQRRRVTSMTGTQSTFPLLSYGVFFSSSFSFSRTYSFPFHSGALVLVVEVMRALVSPVTPLIITTTTPPASPPSSLHTRNQDIHFGVFFFPTLSLAFSRRWKLLGRLPSRPVCN